MIGATMQDAFNEQMKHEFYSCYLYLSMSAYGESAGLPCLARSVPASHREAAKRLRLAEQLRMVGYERPGRLMLDRELGQRRGGGDEGAGEAPKT